MFTRILVSLTMAIICDETVNYWWGAQRWGNAKVGLADSRRCTTGGQTNKSRDDRNKELGLNFINCSASGRIHFFSKQFFLDTWVALTVELAIHFGFLWIHFIQSQIIAYPCKLLFDGLILAMLLKAQKLNFGQDFECKGWSKFLKLDFDQLVIWL